LIEFVVAVANVAWRRHVLFAFSFLCFTFVVVVVAVVVAAVVVDFVDDDFVVGDFVGPPALLLLF